MTVGVPYGGTPTIYRNVAIIGAATGEMPQGPPGNPRAFDVVTGKKLWEFRTVPQARARSTTTPGATAGRIARARTCGASPRRSMSSAASSICRSPARRRTTTAAIGRATTRLRNSIVAVDAQTGKYLWHFQTVHHDIWDIDMPTAGALFDFVQGGRRTPAIAHVGKSSYVFVLDRVTGKPLIPVEERPVPKGDVPTEWYSPTQPFPVRPGPLSRVSFNKDTDLVRPEDTSPEHVAACVGDDGEGRRLLQRRRVHAVPVQGDRRAAEVHDSVPGRHRRRELGRHGDGSDDRRLLRQRAEHVAGRVDRARSRPA